HWRTVYARTNVTLKGQIGAPEDFAVRFTLESPFLFDRRRGHLVLGISATGHSGGFRRMDAEPGYVLPGDPSTGTSFDRGAFIVAQPFGQRAVLPGTIVTEFAFKTVVTIDAIRSVTNSVEIEFSGVSDP